MQMQNWEKKYFQGFQSTFLTKIQNRINKKSG